MPVPLALCEINNLYPMKQQKNVFIDSGNQDHFVLNINLND